jgi:hypothetical protein
VLQAPGPEDCASSSSRTSVQDPAVMVHAAVCHWPPSGRLPLSDPMMGHVERSGAEARSVRHSLRGASELTGSLNCDMVLRPRTSRLEGPTESRQVSEGAQ